MAPPRRLVLPSVLAVTLLSCGSSGDKKVVVDALAAPLPDGGMVMVDAGPPGDGPVPDTPMPDAAIADAPPPIDAPPADAPVPIDAPPDAEVG